MKKFISFIVLLIAWVCVGAVVLHAAQAGRFFEGKTINIVVGSSAGGGFDAYSRAIARHIGKHIPGKPTVIVTNQPGAGTLIAAKHVFSSKPDGLTIGNFIGDLLLGQVLGQQGIDIDLRKFEWLGVPVKDDVVCALSKASGVASVESWQKSLTPVKLGGTSGVTVTSITPQVLKTVVGLPIDLVQGYAGSPEIQLATETGEVAGGCWTWASMRIGWRNALESGKVSPIVQVTAKPLSDLLNVPLANTYAKTAEAKLLLDVAVQNQTAITRLYALTPRTPKDRVQILRKAFMSTMNDPEFVAEMKKARRDVDPIDGGEVEKIAQNLFELGPGPVAKLKEILLPKN